MKIRKGFVSNSSSSSYTCEVCGEELSGRDINFQEYEIFGCINDHIICVAHELPVADDMKKTMLLNFTTKWDDDGGESVRAEAKKLIDGDGYWEDLFDETFEEYEYESPAERCPICQFTEISKKETVEYLFKKNNTTEKEIMEEIKNTFSNYAELKEHLKNKEKKNEN